MCKGNDHWHSKGQHYSIKGKINHGDYILIDGSDIQKKYARFMEGLGFVKDGDKGTIGLGAATE